MKVSLGGRPETRPDPLPPDQARNSTTVVSPPIGLRYQKRQEIKLRPKAKAKDFKLVPLEQAGCVLQKRGQNARRSKIGLRHEACSEAAKGRGVLPVQTRRQRVKDAAVDWALIAENIVE